MSLGKFFGKGYENLLAAWVALRGFVRAIEYPSSWYFGDVVEDRPTLSEVPDVPSGIIGVEDSGYTLVGYLVEGEPVSVVESDGTPGVVLWLLSDGARYLHSGDAMAGGDLGREIASMLAAIAVLEHNIGLLSVWGNRMHGQLVALINVGCDNETVSDQILAAKNSIEAMQKALNKIKKWKDH